MIKPRRGQATVLLLLILPAGFLALAGWTLRAYLRSWRHGTTFSAQIPPGGLVVAPEVADRCALPIGLMWLALGLILVGSPWATSRGEKLPAAALYVAVVGVAVEAVAIILFCTAYLFNRPKFLLPPTLRSLPGRWTRSAARQDQP